MPLGRPLYDPTRDTRIAGLRRDVEMLKRRSIPEVTAVGVAAETFFWDPHADGFDVASSTVLEDGLRYLVTIQGTFSSWNLALGDAHPPGEGTPDPNAMFPGSTSGRVSTEVGLDADTEWANPDASTFHLGHRTRVQMDVDGSGPVHVEPDDGSHDTPRSDHLYSYTVTGSGVPVAFHMDDVPSVQADFYGKLKITIQALDGTSTGGGGGTGTGSLVPPTDASMSGDLLSVDSAGVPTFNDLAVDTDGTLAANSDSKIPSQKAVKTYAGGLLAAAHALEYKGATNCSANPNYPAGAIGDLYMVSVAGKIGGASGIAVNAGDLFVCIIANAGGTQASVGADWDVIHATATGSVTGPGSATNNDFVTFNGTTGALIKDSGLALDTDATLAANSDSKIPSQKAVKGYVDSSITSAPGPTVIVANTKTTSYTLVLGDAGKVVEMNSASALTLTVPPHSSVAWPDGTVIEVYAGGAGVVTVAAGAGVTLRNVGALAGQYKTARLRYRTADEWVLSGELA